MSGLLACPDCGGTEFNSHEPATAVYFGITVGANELVDYTNCDYSGGDGEFADDLECRSCHTSLRIADLVDPDEVDSESSAPVSSNTARGVPPTTE